MNICAHAYLWKARTGPWAPFVALHLAAQKHSFPELEACHLAAIWRSSLPVKLGQWALSSHAFYIGAGDLN